MKDFMTGKNITQEESSAIQEKLSKFNQKPFLWYSMFKQVMLIEVQVGPECKVTGSWKNGYPNMKVKIERFYKGETETWYERPRMLEEMYACCEAPMPGFVPWPIMEWVMSLFINHIGYEDMSLRKEDWDELKDLA